MGKFVVWGLQIKKSFSILLQLFDEILWLVGLSLKTQDLTAMFLAPRLCCSFFMEGGIHTFLDFVTLVATLWVVYMMRFKLKSTYIADLDNMPLYYVVNQIHHFSWIWATFVIVLLNCGDPCKAISCFLSFVGGSFCNSSPVHPSLHAPRSCWPDAVGLLCLRGVHLRIATASDDSEHQGRSTYYSDCYLYN